MARKIKSDLATRRARRVDFQVAPRGSIDTIYPVTLAARAWLADNTEAEGWQIYGRGMACEPRCAYDICEAMVADGLRGEVI